MISLRTNGMSGKMLFLMQFTALLVVQVSSYQGWTPSACSSWRSSQFLSSTLSKFSCRRSSQSVPKPLYLRRTSVAQGVTMMAKKKMTEAQLRALEALQQFENQQTATEAPQEEPKAEPEAKASPAAAGGKKKGKKLTPQQLKMLEAVEAFETTSSSAEASQEEASSGESEGQSAGKKKKKLSKYELEQMEKSEITVSEETTKIEHVVEEVKVVEDDVKPSKKTSERSESVPALSMEEDLDFLGLGDNGRPKSSKKKQGKKGKEKSDEAESEMMAEESTESEEEAEVAAPKVNKRPPPRVRIDSAAQPGYVSLRMEKIALTFKNQDVLKDCSWSVQTGDRVGLVGANGGGKTTQLRVLYGELEPDSGDIIKSSADLRLAFLRQEFVDELVLTRTLKEELMSVFGEEAKVLKEIEEAESELAMCNDDMERMQGILDRMQELQNRADSLGVTGLDARVERIMNMMGFSQEEGDQLVASFSGGWKMRIGLGKILLTEPNILLLDEPTNHLDLESIEWMESFLINQNIPMVIVSHDREFLDRVCTKIVDCEQGVTNTYDGNYSRFLKLKKERMEAWQKSYDNQMKKVKAEKDWINRFKVGAQASQAASRQTKLEKWMASEEFVQKPPTPGKPWKFRFPPAPRMGNAEAVVNVKNLEHGYEMQGKEVLFKEVEFNLEKGDRVALIGPNGCGKSTFLRLIVGKEDARSGEIKLGGGQNLAVNYYEQNQADVLDPEMTVIDVIKEASDGSVEYEELRKLLGQFLFKGDTVEKKIAMLSGGEKARVALCRMMLRPANLLVLDEPTNHLDIPAKEMLEEALKFYDGTLLVISHDRYFVSQVANIIAAFEDKRLVRYNGDYKHYMDQNEKWANKVQSRYVDGVEGIQELALPEVEIDKPKKTKNFGGSAVTSGRKDKGVKNAKRMQ
mmetsp:Transcript_27471/g.62279  ORF Transcript_27471/g.62279 Transcript_27471/m.62279 type:complete len:916 (-) Transcript_27471:264-3011(-)